MKSCSKVKKFCPVVAASVSAPLECNNWRPACSSAAECIAQLAVCTLYCKLQPMCSLTGEHSSSSRSVCDCRVSGGQAVTTLHPGIHIDGLKLPPSPVPVYILPPVSTNHVSSVSGSLLLIAHPAPAGVECVLASLAAVSWCPGSSLLTCQYPLQQKVFSDGLHQHTTTTTDTGYIPPAGH